MVCGSCDRVPVRPRLPGFVNPYLYELAGTAAFHDVSQGSNTLRPGEGFLSITGYDAPTGVGSPDVANLVT